MLAKRRAILLDGSEIERTPLLVPSFSSKGFPNISKIVDYTRELMDGVALFSAYDLHYNNIMIPENFASMIFLDSGGYEASKDSELSSFGDNEHQVQTWTQAMHEEQLKLWRPTVPSVLISFDHPKERLSIKQQIERARNMAPGKTGYVKEILLKPETPDQTLLSMKEVIENVHGLAEFGIIGLTEKEAGNSILDRMKNIASLRNALRNAGLDTPIHVFGSLDTISSPLYFLAGADIFDGLTWLRFAYYEGRTLYKQNFGALQLGVMTKAHVIDGRCWNENYYYMKKLELEMRSFLKENDFNAFTNNAVLFETTLKIVNEAVGA